MLYNGTEIPFPTYCIKICTVKIVLDVNVVGVQHARELSRNFVALFQITNGPIYRKLFRKSPVEKLVT